MRMLTDNRGYMVELGPNHDLIQIRIWAEGSPLVDLQLTLEEAHFLGHALHKEYIQATIDFDEPHMPPKRPQLLPDRTDHQSTTGNGGVGVVEEVE